VGIVAAAAAVRLFFEIRRCPWAIGTLVACGLSCLVGAAAQHAWPVALSEVNIPFWVGGSWLVGYVLVLTTFLLYARHVQLDVAGSLAVRGRKRRKTHEAPKSEDVEAEAPRKPALRLRTDLDPVEPVENAAGSRPAAGLSKSVPSGKPATGGELQQDSHLSRAERRRIRREARMAS
jgi:hypothetical protein